MPSYICPKCKLTFTSRRVRWDHVKKCGGIIKGGLSEKKTDDK